MRLASALMTLGLCVTTASAQELERPADWKVRFDHPAPDSALYFVTMTPGWHITTGPSGIMYDPEMRAEGEYRVRSEISLFPGDRREGFGVFVGGKRLQDEGQSYLYFLVRKDGRFLLKARSGSETDVIQPWTEHDAIVKHEGGEESVKNVLEIDAGADTVRFLVNGAEVASLPRDRVDGDGIVGLRVNHGLDLHVSELSVEER